MRLRFTRLVDLALTGRRPIVVAVHLGLIALSNYLGFMLRFDGAIPPPQAPFFFEMLPWLILIRALTFIPFRLYEGLWRYTSLWDLRNIIAAVMTSTALFYGVVRYGFGEIAYSRSIFIIDSIVLVCFMIGVRLTRRVYRDFWRPAGERRVLIYGAGDAGEMIVRDMKQSGQRRYEPIGFIDDHRDKIGQRIHGVPVLGSRHDIPRILALRQPHEIVMAIPGATAATMNGILEVLAPHKIRITTLPKLQDIIDGTVTVSQIRTLSVEDLLTRAAVGLDPDAVERFISGRRVMVTGAGGSIGSELCRQISVLKPAALIMYERYENSLFAIVNDLGDREHAVEAVPIIGDVTDVPRLDAVLAQYRPDVIFHAAAHKHVPLMEQNPCEAVKNNVTATRLLADAAERHGVARFILISTDKAVNPTSVMGVTKRVAELIVQAKGVGGRTSFSIVRFGNVLASNGSVVPRFLQQIHAGGPVTVTHPDVRRYFMLISEAVQLVLHTAARGASGETYVLEMGEQVKLVDLARNLIRLSGLAPEDDIKIVFVGLRPGEKLFEELIGENETEAPSDIERIGRVRQRSAPSPERLRADVSRLERLAIDGHAADVRGQLRMIVPEFRSTEPDPVGAVSLHEHAASGEAPLWQLPVDQEIS